MMAYKGKKFIALLILNLGTGWRFHGQHHSLATSPMGKELSVPIEGEAGWVPKPFWTIWRREEYLAVAEIQTLDRPASSVSTVLTTLPQLSLAPSTYI
jgi:hypothetical protein